jgi:hypothetical protein
MKEKICLLTSDLICFLRGEDGECRSKTTRFGGVRVYGGIDCRHAIDAHPAVDEEVQE